jgi:hypothetical protein
MAAARGEFLTVPEHQRKCSYVRWAVGISFVAIGLLLTLVLFAVAASNKASADSENAHTAAADVKRALDTHTAVQDVTMGQIKSDLAEIKADLKEVKAKLK